MHLNSAVVAYETEVAKAIHKETHPRAGGADHICQGLLGNWRDKGLRFAGLAEFRHDQESSRKPFFAGIEKLVDKIGLSPHASREKELKEHVSDGWFVMHHAGHFIPVDSKRGAGVNSCGCSQAPPNDASKRLFSHEVRSKQKGNRRLLAVLRNDG